MNQCNLFCFAAATAVLLTANTALAVDPPNLNDLIQGTWELNVAKSKFCGPVPQKSTREIFDAGWGLIVTTQGGVYADGKPINNHYVARYDGQKYPSTIDRPAKDSVTYKLVNPHRLEWTHWSKDDKKTSEQARTGPLGTGTKSAPPIPSMRPKRRVQRGSEFST